MSHFTKVKTKINNLEALRRALDKLGFQYAQSVSDNAPAIVRGYVGRLVAAKLSINITAGRGAYDLGVVVGEDGCYELVGDWWGIETSTGRTQCEIVEEIAREYSVARVTMACAEAGYEFESPPEYNQETGEVELVAAQWN